MVRVRPGVRLLKLAAAPALLALGAPAPLTAQSVVLDEGTFTVYVSGREAGSETFTIRRQGSGPDATFLANAVVTLDGASGSEMRPTTQTASDRSPLAYENVIEGGDVSNVRLRNMGRRYVARISSTTGERERELRAEPASRILDPRVAHHYWFLGGAIQEEGAHVPVVIPRDGERITMTVVSVTAEQLELGGQSVRAERVRLSGNGDTRDVWFDDQGRVLQVEVPADSYRAVRRIR